MEYDEVISWLRRRVKKDAISALTLGLATLIAGMVLLAVTWVVIYSVALLCLQWVSGTWSILTVIIPTLAIPTLFWGNATTSREYLSEYKVTTGTSSSRVISFYLPGAGMVSNVNPLAPDTADAMTKLIVDCLFAAPRTIIAAFSSLTKAHRLRHIDIFSCAAVIAVLTDTARRMTFQDIVDSIDGMDPTVTFPQLRLIKGILFLNGEPAGLALGTDLKKELTGLSNHVPIYPQRIILQEELKSLAIEARSKLIWGTHKADVEEWLNSRGLTNAQVHDIIQSAWRERNAEIRKLGIRDVVVGTLSLLGSGATFFLAYRSLRLNLRGTAYMWGLALFLFVFGIWRIARGIDRLITGARTEGSLTEL